LWSPASSSASRLRCAWYSGGARSMRPVSQNRLNALFMISTFVGVALRFALASTDYEHGGWKLVASAAITFPGIALCPLPCHRKVGFRSPAVDKTCHFPGVSRPPFAFYRTSVDVDCRKTGLLHAVPFEVWCDLRLGAGTDRQRTAYPAHPTGQTMCLKGGAAGEMISHPDRRIYPRRRTCPKILAASCPTSSARVRLHQDRRTFPMGTPHFAASDGNFQRSQALSQFPPHFDRLDAGTQVVGLIVLLGFDFYIHRLPCMDWCTGYQRRHFLQPVLSWLPCRTFMPRTLDRRSFILYRMTHITMYDIE